MPPYSCTRLRAFHGAGQELGRLAGAVTAADDDVAAALGRPGLEPPQFRSDG